MEKDQRRMPSTAFHVKVFQSFQKTPLLSLEVVIVVNVCEAVFRKCIKRFTLALPAFCFHLCRVLTPGKGQVGCDAVPDAVAHHVLAAAFCADQLPPVYFLPVKVASHDYRWRSRSCIWWRCCAG